MKKENQDDVVKYRIKKAERTLQGAKIIAENHLWEVCINRLYYACFYAVSALLIHYQLESKTHSGIKNLFSLHFVKTNLVSLEQGYFYAQLFDKRQTGDYADFTDYTQEDVEPLIAPTESFIYQIKQLIEDKAID